MMERLGGTIGYILGSIIVVPVVFILINKHSINRNEFETYQEDYLANTTEIILETDYFENDEVSNGRLFAIHDFTTRIASRRGRDASSRSWLYYRKVRDKTGRNFVINVVDGNDLVFSAIDDNVFIARVNIDDLHDGYYGNSENPIPSFFVKGVDKPLESYNLKGDIVQLDISEEQYAYSAEMYWTYVATKDEFERRFGKQK